MTTTTTINNDNRRYPGSYERFLELKEERMHAEGAARDSARNKMRGELAWMRKQPKARQAKSKAREERFFELKAKVGGAPLLCSAFSRAFASMLWAFLFFYGQPLL